MEGNHPYYPPLVQSQGELRLTDVDRGVKLDVSDFCSEINPKVFFDWLYSWNAFLDGTV